MLNTTFFEQLPDFNSPTLKEEIEVILKSDREILAKLSPLLEELNWDEKMAIGQTCYFFIAISSEHSLLKLVPVRGDGSSYSKPLQQALELLEGLSLQRLAEVASKILKEDIEIAEVTTKASEAVDSCSADYPAILDLDGHRKSVRLHWSKPLPQIIYNNKTGIFYQLTRGYSYCQVDGQILSNIES